jgi:hypothetical protein
MKIAVFYYLNFGKFKKKIKKEKIMPIPPWREKHLGGQGDSSLYPE